MEATCVRHTELPHTTKLFTDLVYHFDRVASFYPHNPVDPASFTAAASELSFPSSRRAALVSALREQNGDSASLRLLAEPDTTVVVTGQQVGLFSGPAYTIYKALTAIRLAERLSRQGTPSVPVFWLATEDHDFAEIQQCWVFDGSHRPTALQLAGAGPDHVPVGRLALEGAPLAELKTALGPHPFGEEVASAVEGSYVAGRKLGAAFRDLLQRLLGDRGLLFLDPLQPAMRALAAPLLKEAASAAPELTDLLLERNSELEAAGYHAQVHIEPQTSLFFLLAGGRRISLRREDGSYHSSDRRFSEGELAEAAEHLSPNAVLRPVAQDYMLPTVAYVGGPAELAYLAQAEVLYRKLLGRMPVAVPRSGFTLLDSRSAKLLRRYDLTPTCLFEGEEAVREKIARRLVPPSLDGALRSARGATEQLLDGLRQQLAGFDPTLEAALGKSRGKILYQLARMERKTAREALRRDERAAGDAAYLHGLLYPNKHLQERFYSILPFLARHGPGLMDCLYENVRLECPDHILLTV